MKKAVRGLSALLALLAALVLCSCSPTPEAAEDVAADGELELETTSTPSPTPTPTPTPMPTLPYKATTYEEIDLGAMPSYDKIVLWRTLDGELKPDYWPAYEEDAELTEAFPSAEPNAYLSGVSDQSPLNTPYSTPDYANPKPWTMPTKARTLGEIDLNSMSYEDKMYLWMSLSVNLRAYTSTSNSPEEPEAELQETKDPSESSTPNSP